MQTMKNKFKNIRNEHLKSIYKDTTFIMSLKQPKNFYRDLASPRVISNFDNIRKLGTYKCSDKSRDESRTVATSKIEHFVLIVNG